MNYHYEKYLHAKKPYSIPLPSRSRREYRVSANQIDTYPYNVLQTDMGPFGVARIWGWYIHLLVVSAARGSLFFLLIEEADLAGRPPELGANSVHWLGGNGRRSRCVRFDWRFEVVGDRFKW